MHPRNRHKGRYDFEKLKQAHHELTKFVALNRYGDHSIDFANPDAVKCLNRALLKQYYGVEKWDIPPNYLCPPIPGRADYIHSIADLPLKGSPIRGLDIGVGANCIFPIIGYFEYGWDFVGTEINPISIQAAQSNLDANAILKGHVSLRLQPDSRKIFEGVIEPFDRFSFSMCNPPFHASYEEAQAGSKRKWNNLGKAQPKREKQLTNFGGQGAELWCEGGEVEFIERMISESILFKTNCDWFTTLVSRQETLPRILARIERAGAANVRVIDMSQGQKKSRIVCWTFFK